MRAEDNFEVLEYRGRIRSTVVTYLPPATALTFRIWKTKNGKEIGVNSLIECQSCVRDGTVVSAMTVQREEEIVAEFTRRLLIYQTDRNSAKTLKVLSITTEEIQKPVRRKPLLP